MVSREKSPDEAGRNILKWSGKRKDKEIVKK
jgi:hypothetical protein